MSLFIILIILIVITTPKNIIMTHLSNIQFIYYLIKIQIQNFLGQKNHLLEDEYIYNRGFLRW